MKRLAAITAVMCTTWLSGPTAAGQDAVRGDPAAFAMKAAEASANAIGAGTLAFDKASSAEARALAERLVNDHRRAREELIALARTRHLDARPETVAATVDTAALVRLSGASFDGAFATQVMLDLGVAVALCEEHARSGTDAATRAWAARVLPVWREHLREARELAQ